MTIPSTPWGRPATTASPLAASARFASAIAWEALGATLGEALAEVEHALAKVADGTYGVCEDCGEPIDPLRLEAKPAARYCINCAAKH